MPQNKQANKLTPEMEAAQWKPGQSGNPGGRPKKKPITDALAAALDDPKEMQKLIKGILAKAQSGDTAAFSAIRDTTEGKPVESHEHSGKNGGPIVFALKRIGQANEG